MVTDASQLHHQFSGTTCQCKRRSQDFYLGGGAGPPPADVTRYNFRDLRKPTRFGGGGGGSSRNFP